MSNPNSAETQLRQMLRYMRIRLAEIEYGIKRANERIKEYEQEREELERSIKEAEEIIERGGFFG